MKITILSIGKKHEPWVQPGIERFLGRLRPPFTAQMILLPPPATAKGHNHHQTRHNESQLLLARLTECDFVILLDERGQMLDSPSFCQLLLAQSQRPIVLIIGGAYGVTEELRQRADVVWSLSKLVFPHQLVRLILTEQLYRAQEIYHNSPYHHQ